MATTEQVGMFKELMKEMIDRRVKDAIELTKEEARDSLNKKLDQIALEVAVDMYQSHVIEEMAERITFEIKGSYASK